MTIKNILQTCLFLLAASLIVACSSGSSGSNSVSSNDNNNGDNNISDGDDINVAPIAAAGADQAVDVGDTVTLDASASSDSDGNITSYSWSQTAGADVGINNPDSEIATFVVPESASDSNLSFELTVVDDDNASASDSLAIVVSDTDDDNNDTDPNPDDSEPVANAGEDQRVNEGAIVELNASASSAGGGTIATYQWTQIDGAAVDLNNSTSAQAFFEAPQVDSEANFIFRLTVTNTNGAQSLDSTIITVLNNEAPTASASAEAQAYEGTSVTLDGSASSDSDGSIATYLWEQTAGPTASIANPAAQSTTFTAPAVEEHTALAFLLTVTDNDGAQSTDEINITIIYNAPPTADAGANTQANEGSNVQLDGSASSDTEDSNLTYLWQQVDSSDYSVTLSDANSSNPSFTTPEVAADTNLTFQLTVTDSLGKSGDASVVVSVIYNIPPTANAGATQEVNEIELVQLDGSASSDTEDSNLTYLWQQVDSSDYSVTLNDANSSQPSFTTPQVPADTDLLFQLTVTDSLGKSSDANVTISIVYNTPPSANAGSNAQVNENEVVQLDGSASSDIEGSDLTYFWQQTDSSDYSVTLSDANSVNPTFTSPAVSANTNLGFQLSVTDSLGKNSRDDVIISVIYNNPPVASVGNDQQVSEGDSVQLYGAGSSDIEDISLTYLWQQVDSSDYPVTLSDANSANPSFTAPNPVAADTNLSFQLTVTDSLGKSSDANSTVSVIYNNPPIARAGDDQGVEEGAAVELDGSASSDSEGSDLIYSWQQVDSSGHSVTLDNADTAQPSFTAPQPIASDIVLSFQLTVTDSFGKSGEDNVTVSVFDSNPPIANAGADQSVNEGETVELNGSVANDVEGLSIAYLWQQVDSSGYAVTLSDANIAQPSFVAPEVAADTDLIFQVTATDSLGKSGEDNVTISIVYNSPPIADAGANARANENESVQLDGSASSDIEDSNLTYMWQQADSSGYAVTLSDANSSNPTFITPEVAANTNLSFQLSVTDSLGKSSEDQVTVSVIYNNPPVAIVGDDQSVDEGASVQLYGSASSDIEGSALSYIWQQVDSSGYAVTLSDANSTTPSFTAPDPVAADTDLVFQLTVTDDLGKSSDANSTVRVIYNTPPVASVSADQSVNEGASVELDGSASADSDGSIASYSWQQVDSSGYSISLDDTSSASPSFTTPNPVNADTNLTFQLTVTDNLGKSGDANVTITVIYNTPPTANAGAAQSIYESQSVQLDASASSDIEGSSLAYSWQQVDSSGYSAHLSNPNLSDPTFTAPEIPIDEANLTFQLTVTDDLGKTDDATVTITVLNNNPPIATASTDAADPTQVNEGATIQLDGSASSDVEDSALTYLWQQVDSSGYTVTLSDANSSQPSFTTPVVATNTNIAFQLTVSDKLGKSSTDSITITIIYNAPPSANAGANQSFYEGTSVELDGSASSDSDGTIASYSWQQVDSSAYSIALIDANTATSSFTTPVVSADTDLIFQLTVSDNLGKSSDANVSITVFDNLPPSASAGADQSLYESESVQLVGSGSSDSDGSIASYSWQQIDSSGYTISLDDANSADPTFTAPEVTTETELTFQLTVTDDDGVQDSDTVVISITDNNPPSANVGSDQSVNEGASVQLNGSASSDVEDSALVYSWQQIDSSGYSITLSDADSATPSFTAPNPVAADTELIFQLTVSDSLGKSATDTLSITVIYNAPPLAKAGTNQSVDEGASVELDGSASSDSEDAASALGYLWQQVDSSGYSITLNNANTAKPTFTAPNPVAADTDLIFQLTVSDSLGKSADANVSITVIYNNPPIANAGTDQSVFENTTATLDGSASSDSENSNLAYSWQQVDSSGYSVALSNANSANASFTALDPVSASGANLTFQLTVTDSLGKSSSANVTVTIIYNNPPVADAGSDQPVYEGDSVELDGSASSDVEDSSLSYLWQQVDSSGYSVTLNDADTDTPSFTAPNPVAVGGTSLVFQLTVSDSLGKSSASEVTVVIIYNEPPTASAGNDRSAYEGTTVELDGSASSDSDGSIASYSWQQVDSSGYTAALIDADSATPSFTVPEVAADASLSFQLTVTDDSGKTSAATVTVIALDNTAPQANAGVDQDIYEGQSATLDASASSDADGDNDIITYLWQQTAGPEVSITNADSEVASFTAPAVEADTNLSFELTVTDAANVSATDSVIITILNNEPPIANAGVDQFIGQNYLVQLDGTASSDSDGSIASYSWQQVDDSGHSVTLNDSATAQPSFITPEVELDTNLRFELTVTDNLGASSSDIVIVTVNTAYNAPPTASAGGDQSVNESQFVQLDGSASSDSDGSIESYFWQQIDSSGYTVTLDAANSATPGFTAPGELQSDINLTFQLRVTDNYGATATDSVTITVLESEIEALIADAGAEQEVNPGASVQLSGSALSASDANIESYSWQQIDSSGYLVTLSDANIATPTFTAPIVSEDTALVFRLTVTDDLGYTATDTVTITVDVDNSSANNVPPVAYAGDDQTVSENVQVQLDSSGSNDPDGHIEQRKWQQIDDSGYSVVLDASGAVQPKFLSPRVAAETELIFQVTITDDQGATDVAFVVITVTYSAGPTADAGADQEVDEGEVVQLDGTASSQGSGSGVTPYWQQIDTSGYVVRLSDVNSDQPTFTAPNQLNADTDLTFQLTVVDNATGKDSVPDTVTITVNDSIQFQADAGIDNAQSAGTIAHLRSSNTDASSYLWEQITSYAIVIDRADTSHASFQVPEDLEIGDTLSFRLTVTNADQTITDTDTTSITIADPGNLKWHFSTGTILIPDDEDVVNANTSPTIGPDGTVYFGSYDHQFYALNPEDGSVKWSFDAEGPLRSPAIVGADGTVYLAVSQYPYTQSVSDPETGENFSDNYLYAVSPPTGSNELGVLKWRRLMTSYTSSHFVPEDSVAISADGTLYLGGKGDDGELLYALDPEDGSTKWTFVDSDDVDVDVNRVSNHTPAISPDGTIYMGGYRSVDGFTESFFYAINPPSEAGGNTGELLWRYRPPDESVRYAGDETHNGSFKFSNPAIGADGIIYITNSEHSIYAFNPSDGSRKWRSTGSDGMVSSSNTDIFQSSGAVAADGTIYFGGVNGNDMLYALKPTDGTRKWAYDVRDEDTFAGDLHHVKSGAVLGADGRTYFASNEKKVYALDSNDTDSELVWSYALDDKPSYSTSVIASDGTLFITDSTGMYAIHTSAAGLAADSPWPRSRNNNRGTSRANLAPTAAASASQLIVNPGMTVSLDAAASTDPDGAIIDYYWRETSGFDISIQDSNSAQASFVVPSPAANSTLSIELTVTDDHGTVATTTLSIDIEI